MGVLTEDEFRLVSLQYEICMKMTIEFYFFRNLLKWEGPTEKKIGPLKNIIKNSAKNLGEINISLFEKMPLFYLNSLTEKTYPFDQDFKPEYVTELTYYVHSALRCSAIHIREDWGLIDVSIRNCAQIDYETTQNFLNEFSKSTTAEDESAVLQRYGVNLQSLLFELTCWSPSALSCDLLRLHGELGYELSFVNRDHPSFYRRLKSEQDAEQQAKEDEVFKQWGLTLDREKRELTRTGYETRVSINPREIKLLTDIVQCSDRDSIPQMVRDNSINGPVSLSVRNIASNLRNSLGILGLTLSRGPEYTIKIQTSQG